jgi:hypothetical protein
MSNNSKEGLVYRTCVLLVQHFRNLIEARAGGFNCGFHSRIFQHMLHREFDFVGIGQSAEVTNESGFHPEHVVPCAVLISETCRLIEENGLSDTEIAKLLQKHWKIARITKEQARQMDVGLGYKSEMPSGWCFEFGETLARLDAARITLLPISK